MSNLERMRQISAGLMLAVLCWTLSACEPAPDPASTESLAPRALTAADLVDRPQWEDALAAYPHPDAWEPEVLTQAQLAAEKIHQADGVATLESELTGLQDTQVKLVSSTIQELPCLVFSFEKAKLQIALPLALKPDSPVYFLDATSPKFKPITDKNEREWRGAKAIIQRMAGEMFQGMNRSDF